MIPKLSTPMTKLIRTTEGILLLAFNIAGVVLPALNDISFTKAWPWLAITNGVAFASRQLLKAVAVTQPIIGAPIPLQIAPGLSADDVLAEIAAVETATATVQAQPGTPLAAVTAGLAPDPAPSAA